MHEGKRRWTENLPTTETLASTVVASPKFMRVVVRLLDTNPDELLSERGYTNPSVLEAETDRHLLEGATQWMQAH